MHISTTSRFESRLESAAIKILLKYNLSTTATRYSTTSSPHYLLKRYRAAFFFPPHAYYIRCSLTNTSYNMYS